MVTETNSSIFIHSSSKFNNTSYRLKALDGSFYSAVNTAHNTECSTYLRCQEGERLPIIHNEHENKSQLLQSLKELVVIVDNIPEEQVDCDDDSREKKFDKEFC